MTWIADLLSEVPGATRYQAELEGMERENTRLKAALRALRTKLETKGVPERQMKEDAQRILSFLHRREYATSSQIVQALSVSRESVERYLKALVARRFVHASSAIGQDPEYYLGQAGKNYLHSKFPP